MSTPLLRLEHIGKDYARTSRRSGHLRLLYDLLRGNAPSDYFHRNVHLTFIDEALGVQRLRDVLGVENLLWSSDFPHPVTSWPNSRKIVEEQFAGIPAHERELMVSGNAKRVWNL